jgi:4-hydroxybenzoate polyprenyltransferase
MSLSPYLRLMRLQQPAGIWLLLWPCWWSLGLASSGFPSLRLLVLFGLGAVLMRSAGCVVNDLVDRKFDALVERTRNRPLASGELKPPQAVALLIVLLLASLAIAIALGGVVVLWAMLSLPLVALYPWMKRISWWPQLFLGFTFNWGVLMGWVAVHGSVEPPALMLYIGGIFWTLGYDTIYAHQDKKDDTAAGIKSSALRLGNNTKRAVTFFYVIAIACFALAGLAVGAHSLYYGFVILALAQLMCQVRQVNLEDPVSCRKTFISNAYLLGWLIFAAMIFA